MSRFALIFLLLFGGCFGYLSWAGRTIELTADDIARQKSFINAYKNAGLGKLVVEAGLNKSNNQLMIVMVGGEWSGMAAAEQEPIAKSLVTAWEAECDCNSPTVLFVDTNGDEVAIGTPTRTQLKD